MISPCPRLVQRFVLNLLLGCVVVLGCASAYSEQQAAGYSTAPASADGIGKHYLGREIAHVMGWQGAGWLERQEREQEERTDLLLKALALKPGMTVADIGAGTGYLSRRMATQVAPDGRVLAVDVQPEMIRLLTAHGRTHRPEQRAAHARHRTRGRPTQPSRLIWRSWWMSITNSRFHTKCCRASCVR